MKEGRLQVFVQNNQFLTKKVTSACVLASSYYFVFVFETFRGNHVGTNIGFFEVQDSLAPAPTQENIISIIRNSYSFDYFIEMFWSFKQFYAALRNWNIIDLCAIAFCGALGHPCRAKKYHRPHSHGWLSCGVSDWSCLNNTFHNLALRRRTSPCCVLSSCVA